MFYDFASPTPVPVPAAGGFFESLAPSDWTTLIIASMALLVSVVALVQNWAFRPRPHFSFEWSPWTQENENRVIEGIFRFWNDGEATAHNVRLYIEAEGLVNRLDDAHWERWTKVAPGDDRIAIEVPLEPSENGWVRMAERGTWHAGSAPMPGTPRESLTRPVIRIKYRGRWRAVKSRAPQFDPRQVAGGC